MDLGLKGRNAIICASTSGLGKACAVALASEGANVVLNGRDEARLAKAAEEITALDGAGEVHTVAGDIADEAVRQQLVAAFPQTDILVNNAGGPPVGDFRDWDHATWLAAIDRNMLAAIDLIRLVVDGMIGQGFGRIVNITSATIERPVYALGLSNATRAGLANFSRGLAGRLGPDNVTINTVLPGAFDTERLRAVIKASEQQGKAPQDSPFSPSDPAEMGSLCAFLCSARAGRITGQNITIDGGAMFGR